MFISIYNKKGLNDVVMIMFMKSAAVDQTVETKGDLALIKHKETGDTVGFNLFNASTYLNDLTEGPVVLNGSHIEKLNTLLHEAGFDVELEEDTSPRFAVGYVKSCEPVEGSDHLNLTQTEVDNGQTLQIVCGAGNISKGQKVVVAKPGAVMPDGLIIWPGELKGVKSEGMICSARELGLPQEGKGIMVLPEEEETGKAFNF
ncbi:MAG: DUF4479 domain-containing protein [Alkalibacterium sp.]|nr:DUF4479 domain-containing protein [Alkalibacterium sp.]